MIFLECLHNWQLLKKGLSKYFLGIIYEATLVMKVDFDIRIHTCWFSNTASIKLYLLHDSVSSGYTTTLILRVLRCFEFWSVPTHLTIVVIAVTQFIPVLVCHWPVLLNFVVVVEMLLSPFLYFTTLIKYCIAPFHNFHFLHHLALPYLVCVG
jgi:hypothetical protein